MVAPLSCKGITTLGVTKQNNRKSRFKFLSRLFYASQILSIKKIGKSELIDFYDSTRIEDCSIAIWFVQYIQGFLNI